MAIVRAQAAYTGHDLDGAIVAYREAAQQEVERAEGILGVGYVLAARNDTDGALAAFRQAAQAAATVHNDLTKLRALRAIANLYETQHRWNDAITAWQEWVAFVTVYPTLGNVTHGRARITAIQARGDLYDRYAPVRQRIEQRQHQNARGPQSPTRSEP